MDPAYDFIHLKNYFLLTTLIVIITQDIYFYRNKKSFEERLNAYMIKNSRPSLPTSSANTIKQEKISKFTDNVSDDELVFDVRNYKNKEELNVYQSDIIEDNISELSDGNNLVYRQRKIKFFFKKNENFLFIIFSIVLGAQFLISTVVMVTSVSIPFYRYITLFIHLLIILISCISNFLKYNFFEKQNA